MTRPAPRRVNAVCRIQLRGVLSGVAGEALLERLQRQGPAAAAVVAVDLAQVTAIERHGADALVDAYIATLLRSATFVLNGLTQRSRESLAGFGLLAVLPVSKAPTPIAVGRRSPVTRRES